MYSRFYVANEAVEKVLQLQDMAESTMIENEFTIPYSQVLALVDKSNFSSHDCEFVALTNQLNIQFVTQNKKYYRSNPQRNLENAPFSLLSCTFNFFAL